ncbi:MAG: GDSL family lipase [Clostridia bacterium]|nr:GDSL family lipase [Clostridia bacterium]
MKVSEKILLDRKGLETYGPINIVILGDSVSHGAMCGYIDHENVYWNRLRKMLNGYRDYMPVNMINASIGGTCAKDAVKRLEKGVLNHNPDLVIVCFGLNDVNGEISEYIDSLEEIFTRCNEKGIDAIFMTPNMLNTYVADDTSERFKEYANKTKDFQNKGKMDEYIYSAVKLAKSMGISVCDCYSKWKKLAETEDTTLLLINRINHPSPEMHQLFADALFAMIIGETEDDISTESAMFSE